MNVIDDLKKLLAAAEGCVCRDSLACRHRKARLRLMHHAEAFAQALVKSQEALKRVQNLPLLMKSWEKSSRDAAYDEIQAALRLDGLAKAMKR